MKIALLVLPIVVIVQHFVEIYNVKLAKIVPLVLVIVAHVLLQHPIVVMDFAMP